MVTIRSLSLVLILAAVSACSDTPEDSTKALAIINGKEITSGEFDLRWSQLPDFAKKTYSGFDGRKKFLDELITRELLLQEARRRGFDRNRALVERVERFKERTLLDQLMQQEVEDRVTVTVEEMQAYYAANRDSVTALDDVPVSPLLKGAAKDATVSFEDVKDQVHEQLLADKKRKRFDDFVASLRAQAKLRVAEVPIPMSDLPVAGTAAGAP